MDRHIFKKQIEEYLRWMDKFEPIIKEIYNKTKSIEDIKYINSTEKCMIQKKIRIMKNKDEYIEKKLIYEAAVKDYIERKLSGKKTSVKKIADIHNIGYSTLQREIKNRYTLGEKYQYDHMTKTNGVIFSYQQEELLLKILKESLMSQFTRTGQACRCRTCFLLKLSTSAYEFTASNTKKCPPYWTTIKHADMSFLEEFEMRHRSEISKFCIENCNL